MDIYPAILIIEKRDSADRSHNQRYSPSQPVHRHLCKLLAIHNSFISPRRAYTRNIPTSFRSMSYRPLSLLTNSLEKELKRKMGGKKKNKNKKNYCCFFFVFPPPIISPSTRRGGLCRAVCTVYSDEDRVSDLSVASGRPTSPVAAELSRPVRSTCSSPRRSYAKRTPSYSLPRLSWFHSEVTSIDCAQGI